MWFGRKLCFPVLFLTLASVMIEINHHSGNSHFYKYLHIFLLNKWQSIEERKKPKAHFEFKCLMSSDFGCYTIKVKTRFDPKFLFRICMQILFQIKSSLKWSLISCFISSLKSLFNISHTSYHFEISKGQSLHWNICKNFKKPPMK